MSLPFNATNGCRGGVRESAAHELGCTHESLRATKPCILGSAFHDPSPPLRVGGERLGLPILSRGASGVV